MTSAPRDLLLQGTAAFIICGSRAAARLPPPRPPCLLRRWAGRAGSAPGGRGGGSGRGSLRLPAPLLLDAGGRACPRPVLSLGRASKPGWGGGKVMHAAKALAPGTGNRGPGFRRRERRRAGPTVSSAIERCRGEGTRGGRQGRCESLKPKQGLAAWGCCVCLRSRLLIGIMWGSGRGGDSCDRRDASRRSAQPRVSPRSPAPQPRPAGERP